MRVPRFTVVLRPARAPRFELAISSALAFLSLSCTAPDDRVIEAQLATTLPTASDVVDEQAELFDTVADPRGPFPRTTPTEAGISVDALNLVIEEAARAHSDSLVILHDGRLLVDRTFGRRVGKVELRSVTKVFTGVAIGMLLADGKIPSLDTPISTWFPEWSDGLRAKVTLRHLLEHSSGIEHGYGDKLLGPQQDTIKYVRSHAVMTEPGTVYSYNNDAVQLLGAIIERTSGEKIDDLLRRRLFGPLDFGDWSWKRDKTSNVYCYAALALERMDLAKFGQLILMKGLWQGKTIVPLPRLIESTRSSRLSKGGYGLLWEMYHHVNPANDQHMWAGFGHSGSYGQYLVILPAEKIVVVRQIAGNDENDFDLQRVINALTLPR